MLVCSLLITTLLLALLSLYQLHRGGRGRNWLLVLSGLAIGVFIYLYGTWVYLSVYLRYVFAVMALLALIAGLLSKRKGTRRQTAGKAVRNGCVALVFGLLAVLYFTGTTGTPPIIDIPFPLKAGRYIVLQGGKGLPANVFHAAGPRKMLYAMDIARLNGWGNRANTIFSKRLEDYNIFGDTIYSPCNCLVQRAISDNPDNTPPDHRRGPHNLNGVVLEADTYYLFMGHMKQNSIFVRAGQQLHIGDPIGLAGNSGMSIEPHVHLQAHAKTYPGIPWYQQPQLFIRFNHRSYLLFDIVDASHSTAHQ